MSKTSWSIASLGLASLMACHTAAPKTAASVSDGRNCVAAYLNGAEQQLETDEQRHEIERALRDFLDNPPKQLEAARYADYQGNPGRWSAIDLVHRYFVPERGPQALDACFYRDVTAPEARAAIQKHLDALRR